MKKQQKKTTALVPVSNYKKQVSDQYRAVCEKTGEFFREVVKFGALLNEVESFLGNEQRREGSGLQGWLEKNCPEVNYKTAQGYKAMAAKCAKLIGGGSQAIAALQGREIVQEPGTGETIDVDGDFIAKRDELFDKVDSRRQLEQMWFEFCGKSGKGAGGRPKAKRTDFSMPPPEKVASDLWADLKGRLEQPALLDTIDSTPVKVAVTMIGVLNGLVSKLKRRVREA